MESHNYTFDVEDYLGDVLADSLDDRELMEHSVDLDGLGCHTGQ